MIGHSAIWWTLASLLVVVCAAPVRAEERNYWRHPKGHFEDVKANKWEEKAPDGGTFHFIEKERNEQFVELHDKSRDCTERLYADRCEVKFKDGPFEKYYDGKWGGK